MRPLTRALALLATLALVLSVPSPAGAITNGQLDAGEHPYVGQLYFYVPDDPDDRFTDPGAWYNCSGTLISPTVVLTAGHCTYGIGSDGTSTTDDPGEDGSGGNDVWVSFLPEPDYSGLVAAPFVPDDNAGRYEDYSDRLDADPTWHRGTAYSHPDFNPDAFYLADAGVVILDEPVVLPEYGEVASLDFLDQFTGRLKAQTLFEAVGYGTHPVLAHGNGGR